jgi:hypothetical protein
MEFVVTETGWHAHRESDCGLRIEQQRTRRRPGFFCSKSAIRNPQLSRRTRASETTARPVRVTPAHSSNSGLQKQGVIARLAGAGRAGVF